MKSLYDYAEHQHGCLSNMKKYFVTQVDVLNEMKARYELCYMDDFDREEFIDTSEVKSLLDSVVFNLNKATADLSEVMGHFNTAILVLGEEEHEK